MATNREELLVELVDPDGQPLGEMTVAQAHTLPGQLHRAFSILLFDDAGNVLLQQRADTKTRFPGRWANTCCGHPRPGQPLSGEAAYRLVEEMGISAVALSEVGAFTYRAIDAITGRVEHEYDHVLTGLLSRNDAVVIPDTNEVKAWRWVALETLRHDLVVQPAHYAPWLAGVVHQASSTAVG